MEIEWTELWKFAWPILRQGLIALLLALLTLLGYDKYVPSRLTRSGDFDAVLGAAVDAKLAEKKRR